METIVGNELPIPAGDVTLFADLVIPPDATGLVLFVHGSGSSRHSPRNRYIAEELNDGGIATLLADLEERTDRLVHLIDWARTDPTTSALPLGLFGASTGAAAALDAAAARPRTIRAIVSRGGRPDLATWLHDVHAPTLLIVGGNDPDILRLNQQALHALTCFKRLDVVPGATHLFEEPGCLEHVATLARGWFIEYLH